MKKKKEIPKEKYDKDFLITDTNDVVIYGTIILVILLTLTMVILK